MRRPAYLSSFLYTLHILFGLNGTVQCMVWVTMVTLQHPILGLFTHWHPTMQGRFSEMEEEKEEEGGRGGGGGEGGRRRRRRNVFLTVWYHKLYLQHSRKLFSDFGNCLVKLPTSYVLKLCILATHTQKKKKTVKYQFQIR